ncbi:MAG: DUF2160 domain-containing protein [Pseudomonadota bacterium]
MEWMAWTWPTGLFFIAIAAGLLVMSLLEWRRPTTLQRGFLPMSTTRGDRFFISLLSAAFIHLLWLGVVGEYLLIASCLALLWAVCLLRWG